MQWVYEQLFRKRSYILKKEANEYKKEARRLKYCNKCEHVWEISTTGGIIKYMHLPKFRLKEIICRMCDEK